MAKTWTNATVWQPTTQFLSVCSVIHLNNVPNAKMRTTYWQRRGNISAVREKLKFGVIWHLNIGKERNPARVWWWGRDDRGMCAEGVVLHDGVEGVVVRGVGGTGRGGGGVQRGAHVFGPQRRQPQRLRRPRLGVQRAPQVQYLDTEGFRHRLQEAVEAH